LSPLDSSNDFGFVECTKAKKGGLARDDDADIEYIGLATLPRPKAEPIARLIYKEYKYDVEHDEDALETGSTPKIEIAKARLHPPMNSVMIASRGDVFCYYLSPWVVQLTVARESGYYEFESRLVTSFDCQTVAGCRRMFLPTNRSENS
jgi:hypothetical protein